MFRIDSELIQDLYRNGLIVKTGETFTGRDLTWFCSPERLRQTLKVLQRKYSNTSKDSSCKLCRQIGNKSVAEALVLDTPNAKVSLRFGSEKLVEQAMEALFVYLVYPELWPMLLVDNPGFEAKVDQRVRGFKRTNVVIRKNSLLCKILVVLATVGPRSLGGRRDSHFQRLRLCFTSPKKPKRGQRHRGYKDQGSFAPQSSKDRRVTEQEFLKTVRSIYQLFDTVRGSCELQIVRRADLTWSFEGHILKGFAEDRDILRLILGQLKTKVNSRLRDLENARIPVEEVVKAVNHELRRG